MPGTADNPPGHSKNARRLLLQGGILGVLLTLSLLSILGCLRLPPSALSRISYRFGPVSASRRNCARLSADLKCSKGFRVTLFISIGSAPSNAALRDAARDGWLRWMPQDGSVQYRFFSDARPAPNSPHASDQVWDSLDSEVGEKGDVVLQPLETGYGDNKANVYGQRAMFQLAWSKKQFASMDYFLRIDDDSFLCLHRLLYELKTAPRRQFFWGRYWCREGRHRADENFMLFSGDLVNLLNEGTYIGKLLPFDDQVTLGWNFGFWSWVLNITIFDDQERLDAQQGYLTDYMHKEQVHDRAAHAKFCDSYIYAHHVRSADVITETFKQTTTRLMYPIPTRKSSTETCAKKEISFLPARHSSKLPDIRLALSD